MLGTAVLMLVRTPRFPAQMELFGTVNLHSGSRKQSLLSASCWFFFFCLAYLSTLKMKALCSSKTSGE
jgi:hypothetical protein